MNLDILLNIEAPKGAACKLGQILLDLEEPYKEALAKLVNQNIISSTQLARSIREAGLDISSTTIQRHRGENCSCQRI